MNNFVCKKVKSLNDVDCYWHNWNIQQENGLNLYYIIYYFNKEILHVRLNVTNIYSVNLELKILKFKLIFKALDYLCIEIFEKQKLTKSITTQVIEGDILGELIFKHLKFEESVRLRNYIKLNKKNRNVLVLARYGDK